jgi:hypothetical protein
VTENDFESDFSLLDSDLDLTFAEEDSDLALDLEPMDSDLASLDLGPLDTTKIVTGSGAVPFRNITAKSLE